MEKSLGRSRESGKRCVDSCSTCNGGAGRLGPLLGEHVHVTRETPRRRGWERGCLDMSRADAFRAKHSAI
eukprot:1194641-Prorocentrum_minimum.AAC.3